MNSKNKTVKVLRPVLIAVLAITLVAGASIGTAWAYFTTYATMKGGVTLSLGDTTKIREDVKGSEKTVTIVTEPTSQPVYVRAKAFKSDEFELEYPVSDGWTYNEGDKFWYYDSILEPEIDKDTGEPKEGSTSPLQVKISRKIVEGEEVQEGDSFNIIVVYETVPVTYNEDGSPKPADWTSKVTVQSTKGGN